MANVAICGATGLVGETVLRVLAERSFPVERLKLFASERSVGRKYVFKDFEYEVENLEHASFDGIQVAFFALDEALTHKYVPKAMKHCLVVDKSSVYRLKEDVPLVVPEVNPEAIAGHKNLIATPNCTTIPLTVALAPLHREFGLKRVVLASYQSASGAGRDALEEYQYETEFVALKKPVERPDDSPFPTVLAGNVIPQAGKFLADGYTTEEHKTIHETRKILGLPELPLAATCVRVPVAVGHSLAVLVELMKPASPQKVEGVLARAAGVKLMSDDRYPTPVDVQDKDEVFVGRVRKDTSSENGILLWICADNLRKGAATNAVQIAELALKLASK
jgi:aspartate-semialdehyde dehydrogenase